VADTARPTPDERDDEARARDRAATARDEAAEARDLAADTRDESSRVRAQGIRDAAWARLRSRERAGVREAVQPSEAGVGPGELTRRMEQRQVDREMMISQLEMVERDLRDLLADTLRDREDAHADRESSAQDRRGARDDRDGATSDRGCAEADRDQAEIERNLLAPS
jgi:hypothetical protein